MLRIVSQVLPVYLLASVLSGQEADDVLPTYTVEATRIEQTNLQLPFAVSYFGKEQIQTASTQLSLDEPLQTTPGVFVLNPYNFAQDSRIAIRGFGARANFGIRGIRLIVDGIPATTPDGQGSVDGLDLGSTGSIEVLRGAASALYGASSGGVILVETESGPEQPFLETRWTFGEDGFRQSQFKAGGQQGALNYLVSVTDFEFDGVRAHNETENRRLNAKFRYDMTPDRSLTAVVNRIDLPLQNDPGGLTLAEVRADRKQARQRNVDFDAGESVRQEQLGLVYRHALSDAHEFEAKAYYVERDFANRLPFESGGQVAFDRRFYGGGALYRFIGDGLELVAGLDYDDQDDARENFDNLSGQRGPLALKQDERIESLGLFVSGRWELHESLSVSASMRRDWLEFSVDDAFPADGEDSGSRRFRETSPMLGLSYRLSPEMSLFANVATSFETPTTTELANPDGGGFNPSIAPQTATSVELGWKGEGRVGGGRYRSELTAFYIDIEDALVPFELPTSPGRDFYSNAGESERVGIEAAFRLKLTDHLSADLSYTWSDFRYEDFDGTSGDFSGNRLPGIPEHFGNIQLNYKRENGAFLRWNTRLVGSLYADDANTESVASYTVSDLRIGFERRCGAWSFAPFIGINNVFDQAYSANIRINAFGGRYYEPAPKRNAYTGVRIRYTFE